MKIDRTTASFTLGVLFIVSAAALGVLWLTPEAQRPDLLTKVAPAIMGAISAIVAAVAAKHAGDVRTETKAQTPVLQQIAKQTNGVLDGRIREGVRAVLDERAATVAPAAPPSADHAPGELLPPRSLYGGQ